MTTINELGTPRWYTNEYACIESTRFDEETSILTVKFADGGIARLNPTSLVPANLDDVDWWRVGSNEHEIIVPHASGWFEIPWDVIRVRTDPEFDAHLTRMDRKIAREVGTRFRGLREARGLTIEAVARSAKVIPGLIRDVEAGKAPVGFDVTPLLRAIGCVRQDLLNSPSNLTATEREPRAS